MSEYTVSPISEFQEIVDYSDGTRSIRCYDSLSPKYYIDNDKKTLQNIDSSYIKYSSCNLGNMILKSRAFRSVGISTEESFDKFVGFRMSDGNPDVQLEISIDELIIDDEKINISKNIQLVSGDTIRVSRNLYTIDGKQNFRLSFTILNKIKTFSFSFIINSAGLKDPVYDPDSDSYIFDYTEEIKSKYPEKTLDYPFLKFKHPELLDPKGNPILEDKLNYSDIDNNSDDETFIPICSHSFEKLEDGKFRYKKWSNVSLSNITIPFLIDSNIAYGDGPGDGFVYFKTTYNNWWKIYEQPSKRFKRFYDTGRYILTNLSVKSNRYYVYRGLYSFNIDEDFIPAESIILNTFLKYTTNNYMTECRMLRCEYLKSKVKRDIMEYIKYPSSQTIFLNHMNGNSNQQIKLSDEFLTHFNSGFKKIMLMDGEYDYPIIQAPNYAYVGFCFYSQNASYDYQRPFLELFGVSTIQPVTYIFLT
jgi:hypothetical protein